MTLVILRHTVFTPDFWVFFQNALNNSKLIAFGLPIGVTAHLNSGANSR
jgi:hypothetical protein